MTEQTGFPPDPAANRAAWLAAHPGAQEQAPQEAAAQVAAHLGAGAPAGGVTGDDLGAQMAAAGATAGLPHEAVMDELMKQIQALSEQVSTLQVRDRQREAAQIAALGEPILQRYANGVRDHLAALAAANPAGADHFRPIVRDAEALSQATADAISQGANDLGGVMNIAARLDRFITRGHARTAPHVIRHLDLSTVAHHLEYLIEEAHRLAPGALAIA